jgi:hypothetical protein
LGFVANVYFLFALQETQRKWRYLGLLGSVVMILFSKSRLALVVVGSVWFMTRGLSQLTRPSTYFVAAGVFPLAGLYGVQMIEFVDLCIDKFKSMRAASSRVRAALGRIAYERWQTEAPVWGHGVPETGPHLVEYMFIGSHHTWLGLLFTKGIVGFFALAIPILWTSVTLVIRAQSNQLAALGLGLILILTFYTFGENLEILAYLYWPALVIVGIALRGDTPTPQSS